MVGLPGGAPPRSHKDRARVPPESDNGPDFSNHSLIPSWLIGRARWARWRVGLARWLAGWAAWLAGLAGTDSRRILQWSELLQPLSISRWLGGLPGWSGCLGGLPGWRGWRARNPLELAELSPGDTRPLMSAPGQPAYTYTEHGELYFPNS